MPATPSTPAPSGSDIAPPNLSTEHLVVPGVDGAPVRLRPVVAHHVDAARMDFIDRGDDRVVPIRHRFELVLGAPAALHLEAELLHGGIGDAADVSDDDPDAVVARYLERAEAAVDDLHRRHAPLIPPDRPSFDPQPLDDEPSPAGGVLVGHLVVDQFRACDVRGRGRFGEDWWEYLDMNDVQQHTEMESLVRDVVDHWRAHGIAPTRHGAVWWVRSLHVHPSCRGQQAGGVLLGHALWSLVTGPYDLVVLEAYPDASIFAPPEHAPAARLTRQPRGTVPPAAVDGLVRYFERMGFLRADDPRSGLQAYAEVDPDTWDAGTDPSRHLGVFERGPVAPDDAVAMFAFTGDLRFTSHQPLRLGRRVQSMSRQR